MKLHSQMRRSRPGSPQSGEDGYILLILLLTVALMIIFTGAILPSIEYQLRHDREEEYIHRGVQYSRAIRAYYKKFSRYPVKIEDLEKTNNLRFLRKRYKDPTNCKAGKCEDFRLLHFGEVKLTVAGVAMPQGIPGANQANANTGAFGQNSAFGGGLAGAANVATAVAASGMAGNQLAASPLGQQLGQTQLNAPPATDSSGQPSGQSGNGDQSGQPVDVSSLTSGTQQPGGQVFGGGPIVGVTSAGKCPPLPKENCEGYREFNHKKKYSDWQFIYDPMADRGGLIMTPNQPPMFQQVQNVNGPAAPGQPGANSPGQGMNGANSFGNNSNSFGNNSNSFGNNSPQPGNNNNSPSPNQPNEPQQQ